MEERKSSRIKVDDIAEFLSEKYKLDKKFSKNIVNSIFNFILDNLFHGNDVLITSFGTFRVVSTPRRKYNLYLKFRPAANIREALKRWNEKSDV